MSSNNLGQQAAPQIQTVPVQKSKTGKYLLFGTLGCLGLCAASTIGLVGIAALSSNSTNTNQSTSDNIIVSPTKPEFTEVEITNIAQLYCKERKENKYRVYFMFSYNEAIKNIENGKLIAGDKLTEEDCKNTINAMSKKVSKEELLNIAQQKVWIGMKEVYLTYSLGAPDKKNVTEASGLKSTQYIYGDPLNSAVYVYVVNGEVTSYQY